MNAAAMLIMLLFGGAIQAMCPAFFTLGGAAIPILPSLVVHYALSRRRGAVLGASMLAGIIQDSLCMIPLGTSSATFCLAGLTINRFRDDVFPQAVLTRAIFGALTAAAAVWIQFLLMSAGSSLVNPGGGAVLAKMAGAALMGLVVSPVTGVWAGRFDSALGLRVELRA